MWTCKVCDQAIEETESYCYHCGCERELTEDQARRAQAKREALLVRCTRCAQVMNYAGLKHVLEGKSPWGWTSGAVSEFTTQRLAVDVYLCNGCGHLELFADGVGESSRTEYISSEAPRPSSAG